ncbi:hypothetical protein M432DRAFT_49266 [Thermoascus aurantiacus ATCC 26904]
MGLLACRRPKKLKKSTATSGDAPNPAPQAATPELVRAGVSSSADQAHRPGLQGLFEPPSTPLEGPEPIFSLDGQSSNQDASSSARAIRNRERRRPLEAFSGRIRRGLSRESRFLSRSSRRLEKHRIRSLFLAVESTAASGSFAQDHSLGSGLVSDRAYDSDAQCISTPKGSDKPAGPDSAGKSTNRSPNSLPDDPDIATHKAREQSHTERIENCDTLLNRHDHDNISLDSRNDSRLRFPSSTIELQSSQEASIPTISANEGCTQEFTDPVENKLSIALRTAENAASETSDEEKARDTCSSLQLPQTPTAIHGISHTLREDTQDSSLLKVSEMWGNQSSTQSKPGRDAVRSDGNTECHIGRSVTYPTALTSFQNSLADIQLILDARHTRRHSNPVGSISEQSSVHLCDMNISKRLASTSMTPVRLTQDQSSGSNRRMVDSSFSSAASHKHEYKGSEAAAPGFGSRRPVEASNRGRDVSSFYLSQTSSLPSSPGESTDKLALKASGPVYTEDSITIHKRRGSGRGRHCYATHYSELLSLTQQSKATETEVPTTGKHGSVPGTNITQSEFTEQFGTGSSAIPEIIVHSDGEPITVTGRSVSVGWMSGGRRVGYGYAFVPNSEDELRTKSDMPAGDKSSVAPSLASPDGRSCSNSKRLSAEENRAASFTGSPSAGNRRGRSSGALELKAREAGEPRSMWTRFTSHTRAERNGPAGPADNVIVRDFYPGPGPETPTRRVPSGFDHLLERVKLKRRSESLNILSRRAT